MHSGNSLKSSHLYVKYLQAKSHELTQMVKLVSIIIELKYPGACCLWQGCRFIVKGKHTKNVPLFSYCWPGHVLVGIFIFSTDILQSL